MTASAVLANSKDNAAWGADAQIIGGWLAARPLDSAAILKKLVAAHRNLAELKGVAASIPNKGILIGTLGLQEAKESSASENIVTTQDELFRGDAPD